MKQRSLSLLLAIACLLSLFSFGGLEPVAAQAAEGIPDIMLYEDNSSSKSFQISTNQGLKKFSELGQSTNFSGITFYLTADIDMSGVAYTPVPSFSGTFDGGYHAIERLSVSTTDKQCGLIGSLSASGVIRRLGIEGGTLTITTSNSDYRVGSFAGVNRGLIEECWSSAVLTGVASGSTNDISVGGIAGALISGGIVKNSYFAGRAVGVDHASGISDWCQGQYEGYVGQIINCFNMGVLSATTCYALGRYSNSILAEHKTNAIINSYYFDSYTTYDWATGARKVNKSWLGHGYLATQLNTSGNVVWSKGAMFPELRGKGGVYQLKVTFNTKGYTFSSNYYYNAGDTYTVQVPDSASVTLTAEAGTVNGRTYTMPAQNTSLTVTVDLPNVAQYTTYPNETTYVITDLAGFTAMATAVNGGATMSGKSFYMLCDINMNNTAHTPIGQFVSDSSWTKSFSGVFYGNNYKVYNLKVNNTSLNGGGLFGSCYKATFYNLHIFNGSVTTANRAGGITGYADGGCKFYRCSNGADIKTTSGSDGAGGLAGVARNSAVFEYCANYGSVTATVKAAAGIAGWGQTNISLMGCINTGVISGEDAAALARVGTGYSKTWTECNYLKSACSTSVAGTGRDENYFCTGVIGACINTISRTAANSGAFTNTPRYPAICTENDAPAHCVRMSAYDNGVYIGYVTVYANVGDKVGSTNSQDYYGNPFVVPTALAAKSYPTPILYGITYNLNGGALTQTAPTTYTYVHGAALPLSTQVEKSGYSFAGWYESSALTGQVHATVGPSVRGDKTYYAKWSSLVTIGTTTEYLNFVKAVNAGDSYSNKVVRITADLNFGGQTIAALGTASTPFSGVLDGNGHTLSNFTVSGTEAQGLVGYLKQGTVQFLKLENCTVSGKNNVGTVVGYNESGLVLGCMSNGTVSHTGTTYDLSYMSFNIRCGEDPSPNTVSERTPRVKTYLANYLPDIIGLQEVTTTWKSVLSTALSGYSSEFVWRGSSKAEAAPLYWKTSKFTVLEQGTFWLSETPDKTSIGWGASVQRTCSYAVLQPKNTDMLILAYNTHLDHQVDKAKIEGIKLIRTRITAMETKYRNKGYTNIYAFVTGDFNAKPTAEAGKYLANTMVEARNNACLLETPADQKTYSAYNTTSVQIIDYIYVDRDVDVKTYKVTVDTINGEAISDHYGLYGTMRLGGNSQGGIVGYNKGNMQSCGFTGTMNSKAGCSGIAGYNAGKIVGCYSTFTPTAADVLVNGIAPKVEGSVYFSYYPSGAGLSGSGSTTADMANSSYLATLNRPLKVWNMEASVNSGLPFICLQHSFVYQDKGDGTHTGSCTLCGATSTEAHKVVTDKAVAATCTTAGKTEGSHCSACNAVIKAQTTIPATGHSYTSKVTTEAGCTEAGVKTYTCSKCAHSYTEAIAAIGHSYTSKVTTAPTCTANGVKTFTCSNCGGSYTEAIPATGHTAIIDAAVAPTCTNSGLTEGSHCAVCGVILQAQDAVARLGHDYSYGDNGDGTHTGSCSRCDKTVAKEHSFVDGACVCGAKEILPPILDETIKIYHTLDLASDISVTFAIPNSQLASYDSYYLECVLPEYEGNAQIGTSTVEIQPVVNGNYYYFTLTGITAIRMGDMVDAVLHMTKGTQEYYSKTDNYSVATYAYAMLNSSNDAKMLTLCADLLRYGAEAQTFKKYRTDSLVDANMTEAHRSYLSNTDALTFTATDSNLGDLASPVIPWVGKTLDLGSKVGMKFVFNAKNYSGDVSKLSMKVSYTGSTGEVKTVTLTGAEVYNAANGYYSFTFYGLLASELRTVVDVAIYNGNTQLSETLRYSAETYATKTTGTALEPLSQALFAYSDSAKAFFAK